MKRVALVVCLAVVGCAAERPICVLPSTARSGKALDAAGWYHLLVERGLDGSAADCTGAPVAWKPPQGCVEAVEPVRALPSAPFGDGDLIISRVDEGRRLVWAITQRFVEGYGFGPVALVRDGKDGPEVLATGTLRAQTHRVRLSLASLGPHTLLVADGECCASCEHAACPRSMVLEELRDRRFQPVILHADAGACLSDGELFLQRHRVGRLPTGWLREFSLSSTVTFEPERILVQENVVVSDSDPSRPGTPPRIDRRADAERILRYQGGQIVVTDSSLWSRMLGERGGGP
jgi:hypothetical protein